MIAERGARANRAPRLLVVLASAALCLALPYAGAALAHAERIAAQPEEGARVQEPPAQLSIEFTEPPTGDAVLEVLDGCGDDVVDTVQVENMEVSAELVAGSPGRWKVSSTVVSGVDGHQTKEAWSFAVAGAKDCSGDEGGADQARDGSEDDDEGSSLPVVPIALGAVAVVGVAVLLRFLTGRSED